MKKTILFGMVCGGMLTAFGYLSGLLDGLTLDNEKKNEKA